MWHNFWSVTHMLLLVSLVLSTNASTEDVMKTTTHGACDYLVKPVHIKELKNIWQHVIRRKMKGYYSMDLHTNLGHRQGIFDDHVHVGSDERSARPCSQLCTRNSEHKKPQTFFWTAEMHQKFVAAVIKLGIDNMFFNRLGSLFKFCNCSYVCFWCRGSSQQDSRFDECWEAYNRKCGKPSPGIN